MPDRKVRTRSAAATIDEAEISGGRWSAWCAPLLRVAMRRPADTLAALTACALVAATLLNALFLQSGPHPAPLLPPGALSSGKETTGSLVVVPRPRPVELQAGERIAAQSATLENSDGKRTRAQLLGDIQRELARRGLYDGAVDGIYGPKMDAAIRDFEQSAGLRPGGEPTEALLKALVRAPVKAKASIAAPPRRAEAPAAGAPPARKIIAAQRALTDFGYGQLRLTGVLDEPTKAAVEKFERDRKLPVKGQLSDRLLRELAAVTGRPFE